MRNDRKTKILSIVALVLAITGMSLGFAAFSSILTISSSATVTPNSDDFKIVVYGAKNLEEVNREDLFTTGPNMSMWSSDYAYVLDPTNSGVEATNAIIDNTNFTVSNMSAKFTDPTDGDIGYAFLIKNEGAYGTYISIPQYLKDKYLAGEHMGICTPGDGATKELVQEACEGVFGQIAAVYSSNGEIISGKLVSSTQGDYLIGVGEYVIVLFGIGYEGEARADGPFSVKFDDFKITFSTAQS